MQSFFSFNGFKFEDYVEYMGSSLFNIRLRGSWSWVLYLMELLHRGHKKNYSIATPFFFVFDKRNVGKVILEHEKNIRWILSKSTRSKLSITICSTFV